MTIDEAKHIANTTKSYTLKRDMLKFIKRKERENEPTNAHGMQLRSLPPRQKQADEADFHA